MAERTAPSPRILLMLEEEDLGHVLHPFLQEEGYAPLVTTSLQEALSFLKTQDFDVIVSDCFALHDAVPHTTVEQLRQAASPTPVGILTTARLSAEVVACRGFAFQLSNPFDLEDLSALIDAALCTS